MSHEVDVHQSAAATAAPALTILFDGLFFLCFNRQTDPATECQVGFVTTAPDHLLSIHIVEAVDVGEGEIEATEYSINLSTARARNMGQIELDVPGATASVTRKGQGMTINRQHPNDQDKDFFKWIIDLENEEMHNTPLTLMQEVLKPIFKITTGEFYTHELSKEGDPVATARKYERIQGNTKRKDFGAVAAIMGVRINTLPQGKAFLKAGELILPLVRKAGSVCVVEFKNRRPELQTKDDDGPPHAQHSSDFPNFYHAFAVNPLERFDFKVKRNVMHAYPPAICYPSSGSKTSSI